MLSHSRFRCPSDALSMKGLLTRTQEALWVGSALALGIHLALTQVHGLQEQRNAVRPLTTLFVKREPRLTKPLELKKRPHPKRRVIQREMVAVRARADQRSGSTALQSAWIVQRLAEPRAAVHRMGAFEAVIPEPQTMAGVIHSSMEAKQTVDMSLELMDITALDTGQYHAVVIVDPEDKRNIKGFLHLALVYSETIDAREVELFYRQGSIHHRKVKGLVALANALNNYTDIRADIWSRYCFASEELLKTPWILMCTFVPFRLAESEAQRMGEYLTFGGFAFADNWSVGYRPGYEHLKLMFGDALATQGLVFGKDWSFERLPNDHRVYHCYFDFDGAPVGDDAFALAFPDYYLKEQNREFFPYLEGIEIAGRFMGILSNKCYVLAWGEWGKEGMAIQMGNTRQLQFGVNLIVFALTQEGSITHRLMDTVQ